LSVILAADGSPEAHQAAEFLCALSLPQWAEITVVGVANVSAGFPVGENLPVTDALDSNYAGLTSQLNTSVPENVRQSLLDAAEERVVQVTECLHHCGAQIYIDVRIGHPALEILAAAEEQDADFIAIGAKGDPYAEPFPLGGVAQKVVKYATCSVLLVR
jgi:nucleotide-binding universal stress UspA family protein